MGYADEAVAQARRAVELDPLNPNSHRMLAYTYFFVWRYPESIDAAKHALALQPTRAQIRGWQGMAYIELRDYQRALTACDAPDPEWVNITCMAITYDKLGRRADAQAALARLVRDFGPSTAYQQAEIHAQWGDLPRSLDDLELALANSDPGLQDLRVDPLRDPLRGEARYKALVARLKFPS